MIKEEKSSFEVGIKGGPNLNRDILSFIDKYVKEIKDNSAAMFIEAGFSKSAGYVDWKNLLRNVAEDLDLDIDKEYDLVSLAQYCFIWITPITMHFIHNRISVWLGKGQLFIIILYIHNSFFFNQSIFNQ